MTHRLVSADFRIFALGLFLAGSGIAPLAWAEAPAPKPQASAKDDITRWNDRSNPRKTLETFFFAIVAYDLAPELIVNAIDCLELGNMDPVARERDAALMAHELSGIIARRSDISLYGVSDKPEGHTVDLVDDGEVKISMARQADGTWKFTRDTVERIPRMRAKSMANQREVQKARQALADGRTDPESTLRTFIHASMMRQDFGLASQCLDLRDIPAKLRSIHGPEQARKLLFVIQRCGFTFPQEFPSDPDGWRYIWHSNHRGRIMIDRVRTPEGKDAWLFSRMTLQNLDALVEGFRNVPPDPRYARVGKVVDASILTHAQGNVPPPKHVPQELGSPRATLRTFFEAIDDLEYDDTKAQVVLSCMDLGEIPEGDRPSMGLRLGAKLHAILRPLNIDLLSVSESWEAESLCLNPEGAASITLARQTDGAWRFDQQSVSHIPEMYKQLSPTEKTALERRTPFSSARQTMRTLLSAVKRGDSTLAAECLDLDPIPSGAHSELGPSLAFKLQFVLGRLGRVVVQEIPNEPEGPRHYVYRGSLGRISLARQEGSTRQGDWLFTEETVRQIDSMFQALLHQAPPAQQTARASLAPDPFLPLPVALRVRSAMPPGLLLTMLGLSLYQWLGLAITVFLSIASAWTLMKLVNAVLGHVLQISEFNLSQEFFVEKLRPLGFQFAIWVLYLQLPLLDLPIEVVGKALPTFKFLWVGLLAWTSLRLIDLGLGFYTHSEHLKVRKNLSDMIVPTATRCLKLVVLIGAVCYQVSLIDNGEWLTKLLAGMGLIGLAASLAAQDTLKNFFGTLLLIGEHPFKIGDLIVVNGLEGTVESVGFRSTRIRTPEDSLMTIPNSVIAGTSIDNRGLRKSRRYRSFVSMAYDTPVDQMTALRDALRDIAHSRPDLIRADKVDIHIFGLNSSSVDLLVNVYFWADTYRDEMEARDWLNREILLLAERLGVEIAYPTQSIHLPDLPEFGLSLHEATGGGIPAPKFAQMANTSLAPKGSHTIRRDS